MLPFSLFSAVFWFTLNGITSDTFECSRMIRSVSAMEYGGLGICSVSMATPEILSNVAMQQTSLLLFFSPEKEKTSVLPV